MDPIHGVMVKGMYLNTWGDARNTEDVTARSFIIFRGDTFKGDTGFVVSSLGGYYQKKHMTFMTSKFTTIFSR